MSAPAELRQPLRDYQEQGVAWLLDRLEQYKAVLLCDDPGLGKTRQALAAAWLRGANRILVIAPAGARRVWAAEINHWFSDWTERVLVVEPVAGIFQRGQVHARVTDPAPLVLIVGYDELSHRDSHLAYELELASWDLLIIDEAHYLKNPSNRTRCVYGLNGAATGIQARAEKVILLTGTPTPNHAGELWQHYRTFWPHALVRRNTRPLTQAEFEQCFTRYRDTVFGRQITGSRNQTLLREALHDVVLRRRKETVLAELPPLQLQDIPLSEDLRWRDQLDAQSRTLAARYTSALADATDDQLIKALQTPDAQTAGMRRQLGEMKVAPAILWLQERLASPGKLLVFAWHRSVIEHLCRGLLEFNPVVITGDTPPKARSEAITMFQQRPQVRIFLGQILACGTAITLTAANEVAIVEPSWVPGENVQAICRAHRLGQRDSVLASFLYVPGTLDERIMRTFRRKAAEISELQGDQINAGGSQHRPRSGPASKRAAVVEPAAHVV